MGYRNWEPGDQITEARIQQLEDQGVLVFADATARDAAVTSPAEGMFAYLQDTDVLSFYDGSSWSDYKTTALDDLSDVSASSPATSQVLTWNGSAWAPVTPTATVQAAGQNHTDSAVSLTTSYQTVRSFAIPGGEPTAGDVYRITMSGDYLQDSAASRTWDFEVHIGATTALTGASFQPFNAASAGSWRLVVDVAFVSASSQRLAVDLGLATPGVSWGNAVSTNASSGAATQFRPVGYGTAAESSASALSVAFKVKSSAATATQTVTCRSLVAERLAA